LIIVLKLVTNRQDDESLWSAEIESCCPGHGSTQGEAVIDLLNKNPNLNLAIQVAV